MPKKLWPARVLAAAAALLSCRSTCPLCRSTLEAASGQKLDSAGEFFAWQHDPEPLGDGRYTVFDNESVGTATPVPEP